MKLAPVRSRVKLSKHCLGTLITSPSNPALVDGVGCKDFVESLLHQCGIKSLGELLYVFPNNSFSLLINLAESHITLHTWPERDTVQLDVFLCNYQRDNSGLSENIYKQIVAYFNPLKVKTTIIRRR